MRDGYVRVAACAPDLALGSPARNGAAILEAMGQADARGVKLLVTPGLSLTGGTLGDMVYQPSLLEAALDALDGLVRGSGGLDVCTVVGLPLRIGAQLMSCFAVIKSGALLGIVPTRCTADTQTAAIPLLGGQVNMGPELVFTCEDVRDFRFAVHSMEEAASPRSRLARLAELGATIIACPCAEAEYDGAHERRAMMLRALSAQYHCGMVCALPGEGESSTDAVYAARHIIAADGELQGMGEPYSQGLCMTEIDTQLLAWRRMRECAFPTSPAEAVRFGAGLEALELTFDIDAMPYLPKGPDAPARLSAMLDNMAHALARRLAHARAERAVIGISGGLDSALALLVTARAMDILKRPREEIMAYTMPCFGTTRRTQDNAGGLARALGVSFETISIAQAVTQHFADIGLPEGDRGLAYENAQARERTQVLMDICSKVNGLMIGPGDMSELALGFTTYNGDHMSLYGVNAGVPKTLVRALVAHSADMSEGNGEGELAGILRDILETPISPELLPPDEQGRIGQKTEEILGPYEVHDFFLYAMLHFGFPPRKIFRLAQIAFKGAYTPAELKGWMATFYRRFFSQQFKRSCMPDGPRVISVSLSPRAGLAMPSDALADVWLEAVTGLT